MEDKDNKEEHFDVEKYEFGELTKKSEPSEKAEEAPQEEKKSELEELKNQYIRLAADFDNYRKRQEQERAELLKYGAVNTLAKIIPAIDNLERAKKSIKDMDDPQKIKESFDIVEKQIMDALNKIGVKKICTVGEKFNPELHEAVMQTPTSEYEDHSIIEEMQSGYTLEGKVLRAALVNVAVSE